MASDIDATIAFWCDLFDGRVVHDVEFAGARNAFLQIGTGRLHLYDQAPRTAGAATVHHLGIETDDLEAQVARLDSAGVSVTDIRDGGDARYAMAEGPDELLLEIFQVDTTRTPLALVNFFELHPDKHRDRKDMQ